MAEPDFDAMGVEGAKKAMADVDAIFALAERDPVAARLELLRVGTTYGFLLASSRGKQFGDVGRLLVRGVEIGRNAYHVAHGDV